MKVVKPIPITPANYRIYSTDPSGYVNAYGSVEYSAVTAYVVGNRVIVDSLQSEFECIQNTTGNAPVVAGNAWWVRVGASNAWKLFDGVVSDQMVGYTSGPQLAQAMVIHLVGLGHFSTVAVLNCSAANIVCLFRSPDVTITSQYLQSVDTTPVIDAWTYCFADLNVQTSFVFDGVDGWGTGTDAELTLYINNPEDSTDPVLVGEIVVGNSVDLGLCHAGSKMELIDYSRKTTDAFGSVVLVQRPYSFNSSFEIEVDSTRRNRVQSLISELRATSCVWFPTVGDANDGIVTYGFQTLFSITYETPSRAYASLEIEGLV